MMLVTVVIPAFNCATTIENAVSSTLGQGLSELELVVVDDASTDETVAVLKALSSSSPFTVLRSPHNKGPAAARNLGLGAAGGEAIAFLDADDEWLSDGLVHLYRALLAPPRTDLVQGQFIDRWPDGSQGQPRFSHRITGVLFKRSVFQKIGTFREELRQGEDFDFWVRLHQAELAMQRLPESVAYYRRRPNTDPGARKKHYAGIARTLKRNLDQERRNKS